ncbi:MAG: ATP-dependent Clp protease ATP-binding subunit [Patescibacteria group bacterium]|nr:ATP-dependent Clp protease ATP-binding subunit [Patescibacteria group bacterium]
MEIDILDKFSTNLKQVLARAMEAAILNYQKNIEPLGLMNALAGQRGSIAHEIINKTNFRPSAGQRKNISSENPGDTATKIKNPTPTLSPDAKRAIEKAVLAANLFSHKYVGTEHLLFGLMEIRDAAIIRELKAQHVDLAKLKNQIENILKMASRFTEIADRGEAPGIGALPAEPIDAEVVDEELGLDAHSAYRQTDKSKTPALDFFSIDLTSPEMQKKIDPLIGRQDEIVRLMQILCRRHKNNPLLIGEPGVGKTAIVEGLAKRITLGEVPDELADKKILALDLSLIVAGTMYRGEFESRLKQIIEEIRNDKNLIVFIDEVHNIIGAGSTAGSLDAANILKPALARGELRCIGATTLDEYKKHIESDPALERRFQTIVVREPSKEETVHILEGIRPNYEKFHRIKISNQAIRAAVELSTRYLSDKFLPDKAIDLVDEAASGIKISQPADPRLVRIRALENEFNKVRELKQRAVLDERYSEAIDLKTKEKELERAVITARQEAEGNNLSYGKLTDRHIMEVISRQLGIPAQELTSGDQKFFELKNALSQTIIGQDRAIDELVAALSRAKAGFSDPTRPLASFLFVGPTGVGKTELARTLAAKIYPREDALVLINMSEYKESYSASKLLGSPAGYIGYKERNKFTDEVRKKPYAVVLFDEFDKAHADVQALLLQILDRGEITDASGRKINFKNTVIILTSNAGYDAGTGRIGFSGPDGEMMKFDDLKKDLDARLKDCIRPELLNRLDAIIYFNSLDRTALESIIKKELNQIAVGAESRGVRIKFNFNIVPALADRCIDAGDGLPAGRQGARAVRKTLLNLVENPLSEMVLNGKINKGDTVKVSLSRGKFSFSASISD